MPNGLFLQAESAADLRVWLKSINAELELLRDEICRPVSWKRTSKAGEGAKMLRAVEEPPPLPPFVE